jgi:hypothetical protein
MFGYPYSSNGGGFNDDPLQKSRQFRQRLDRATELMQSGMSYKQAHMQARMEMEGGAGSQGGGGPLGGGGGGPFGGSRNDPFGGGSLFGGGSGPFGGGGRPIGGGGRFGRY